jgi:LysM repeat protein
VQPGDNLTRIARQFGVSVEALIAANGLANPDRLRPGDVLIIPAP